MLDALHQSWQVDALFGTAGRPSLQFNSSGSVQIVVQNSPTFAPRPSQLEPCSGTAQRFPPRSPEASRRRSPFVLAGARPDVGDGVREIPEPDPDCGHVNVGNDPATRGCGGPGPGRRRES